ncbi:hypothetical protein PANDA_015033, partial [Ailuropoda melanoleuca]
MARLSLSLLLLVATVTLVSRGVHTWGRSKVVRKFQDIPETYVYVQQALWFAMKNYNKASKDKYTFKVVKVLKSQEQVGEHVPSALSLQDAVMRRPIIHGGHRPQGVTESLDYFLEVKIARTMCKKISGENENCLLQQDPQMQK